MIIKSKENNEEMKELIKNKKFNIKVNYDKSKISSPSEVIYEYDEILLMNSLNYQRNMDL